MKHLFIINPIAGKGKALKYVPIIEKIFSDMNEKPILEYSQKPGHAKEISRKYASEDIYRIYSVGGDGTLNEVLNGIVGTESSLGIIPAGSGNDFIKSLTNEHRIEKIIRDTIAGSEMLIDIGKFNERYFINISSLGFDGQVVENTIKFKKNVLIPGSMAYYFGIIKTIAKFDSYIFDIVIDDKKINMNALMAVIANGKYYGGGIMPAPEANIQDGKLDVCLIDRKNRLEILRFLPNFVKGKHKNIEGVHFYKCSRIEISSDREVALNFDGEVEMAKKVVFDIVPNGVKLIVP